MPSESTERKRERETETQTQREKEFKGSSETGLPTGLFLHPDRTQWSEFCFLESCRGSCLEPASHGSLDQHQALLQHGEDGGRHCGQRCSESLRQE